MSVHNPAYVTSFIVVNVLHWYQKKYRSGIGIKENKVFVLTSGNYKRYPALWQFFCCSMSSSDKLENSRSHTQSPNCLFQISCTVWCSWREQWTVTTVGYTQRGWSAGDFIRSWNTDNTSKLASVFFFFFFLLGGPGAATSSIHPSFCIGHVVRCVKVSQSWRLCACLLYLAEGQPRRLSSSTLQFPYKVQAVVNANSWSLLCVCVLGVVGVQRVKTEHSRETLVGDRSICKVNRISSWRSREVLLKAPTDNTQGIINGNG